MPIDSARLHCQSGNSDKVYNIDIISDGGGYRLPFSYGRRGSSLNTGDKVSEPVPYDEAEKLFRKVVNEKKRKGYVETGDDSPMPRTPRADTAQRGPVPQLLNPVDSASMDNLIADSGWLAQEKFDGERRLVRITSEGVVTGFSRTGRITALDPRLARALGMIDTSSGDVVVDGEDMGSQIVLFDLLEHRGRSVQSEGCAQRLACLMTLVEAAGEMNHLFGIDGSIRVAPTARSGEDKQALLDRVTEENGEGRRLQED